jgi:hypothetical protein
VGKADLIQGGAVVLGKPRPWRVMAASSSYSSTAKVIAADQAAAVLVARWAVMTGR